MSLPPVTTRFLMTLFSVFSFFTPFFAIFGIEYTKRLAANRAEEGAYTQSLIETMAARKQYQDSVETQKQLWQEKMAEAKKQYETTKEKQAEAIANNQTLIKVSTPQTTTYTPPPIAKIVPSTTTTPKTKTTTRTTKTS